MDHEFFTHQLAQDQVAWDWLSLQFDDKTELMLHRILRRDAVGMLPSNEIRGGKYRSRFASFAAASFADGIAYLGKLVSVNTGSMSQIAWFHLIDAIWRT